MTDKKEMPQQDKPQKTAKKSQATQGFGARFIILVNLIIALVALASVGYLWQHQKTMQQGVISQTDQLANQTNQIQAQLGQLRNQLQQQQSSLQDVNASIQRLSTRYNQNDTSWTLARADYLLHLAKYNLEFEQNIPIAIKLLETVDQNIKQLINPNLLPLRKALASDIAALQAIKPVDAAGLILRLNALSHQVAAIPLIPLQPTKQLQTQAPSQSITDQSIWRHTWEKSLDTLKKAVIVRHDGTQLTPILLPEQKAYIVENIRLQLSFASWAVLQKNQKLYKQSLQQVSKLLSQFPAQNDYTVQSLLTSISQLGAIDIQPELPTLSASFDALKAVSGNAVQATTIQTKDPS